jgi:uncharacterized protein YceK
MRRTSLLLILVVALAVGVGVAGCGGESTANAPASGGATPQQILASTIAASGNLVSATGNLDLAITLDMDTTQLPEEMKAMFSKPITVSGTFATAGEPQAVDLDLSLGLGGETLNFALKGTNAAYWLRLNDQWYETPPDMVQSAGLGQDAQMQAKMAEMMKLVTDLGVDPATWMKDATLLGEEKLDGVTTYHLQGTPDMAKMLADYAGLMQSPEFVKMMDEAMQSASSTGLDSVIPSPDELQQTQNTIAEAFKSFTVELWVGKDDSLPRKVVIIAQITPPAGQETQGLNAIGITATVSLENVNKPVTVKAPDAPRPYAELETAMQENPGQFLGPLSGLLQGGMGTF